MKGFEKMPKTKPYKHCCVVDADGFYIALVLVLLEQDEGGNAKENI